MTKRTKLILALAVLIGGIVMVLNMNNKKLEKQQQYELETSIAKLIVSEYEGIEEVEFINWTHSLETGTWRTNVVINKTNEITFAFDDLVGLEEISGHSYHPDTFKLIEKPGVQDRPPVRYIVKETEATSLEGVKVIHSSDKERKMDH